MTALATKIFNLSLDTSNASNELHAFYTLLKRSGKKTSKERPCARCGLIVHWVVDCPEKEQAGERTARSVKDKTACSGKKGQKESNKEDGTAFAAHAITSFKHSLIAQPKRSFAHAWILDSGASQSMPGNRTMLEQLTSLNLPISITTAGGLPLTVTSFGTVRVIDHLGERVSMERVLYVPGPAFNLCHDGHAHHHDRDHVYMIKVTREPTT